MATLNSDQLLKEQLFSSPPTVNRENLSVGDPVNRVIAPYALEARYLNQKKRRFFLFAAILCEIKDVFACIIFGLHENTLFPYAGHFLVTKEKILNPATRKPPDTVKCLSDCQAHQYITLFGVLNRALTQFSSYFLHCPSLQYQDFLSQSQDLSFHLLNEAKIVAPAPEIKEEQSKSPVEETFCFEEPRTTTVFYDTSFAFNEETLTKISKYIQPMSAVKQNLRESGRSHCQAFGGRTTSPRNCSEVLGCDQYFNKDNRTNFCAAYENPGCMPFFESSVLLGKLEDRCIVGVCSSNKFSIIATSRIYDRASGELVQSLPDEVFQSLHLPKWISGDDALVLLITRQILQRPVKYRRQLQFIKKCFQFEGFIPEAALNRSCQRKPAPKAQAERIRSNWTKELLDYNFSESFQNSMLEFPESPSSPDNPNMFCINIVRLWIQEVMRLIHGKELGDLQYNESLLLQFFGMTISEFIDNYLPLYGLSPDCVFKCKLLDSHGVPGAVCCEKLPVNSIGTHVLIHHVAPLLDQRHMHFTPFFLVPPSYVALINSGDLSKLERCRSIVQKWANTPYIELLAKLQVPVCIDVENEGNGAASPRKRTSSRVESDKSDIDNSRCSKNDFVCSTPGSKKKLKKRKVPVCIDVENEDNDAASPRKRTSSRVESDKSDIDNSRCSKNDFVCSTPGSKKKLKKRKRQSFEMKTIYKIMKERNAL